MISKIELRFPDHGAVWSVAHPCGRVLRAPHCKGRTGTAPWIVRTRSMISKIELRFPDHGAVWSVAHPCGIVLTAPHCKGRTGTAQDNVQDDAK